VRAVGGEPGALAGLDDVPLAGHGQGQPAGLDPDQLAGGRCVRLAAELLARQHLPAPELDRPGRVGGAQDGAGAAGRPAPQHPGGVRAADPDGRLAAHVDQLGDGHAERVADPGQRGQVGVGAPLLQRHQHALADPRTRRELVQRPATIGPQGLQGASHGRGQVGWVRHISLSA
jgi:hypothetical protein